MTNHYTDVCEETIKSLRQQLADRDEQISDLTISSDTYFAERNSARDVWRRASKDRDELRQQLAEALAAIKIKDEALNSAIVSTEKDFFVSLPKWRVVEALTIQPDDSALKAWLGEPSSWTHSCPVLCLDGVELWIDRCPHCGKPAPKGLK